MNVTATILITAGLALLVFAVKKINPGAVLLSAALGLSALFAADIVLGFMQLNLPVNACTLLCAAVGGVPGAILVTLLNAFLTAE